MGQAAQLKTPEEFIAEGHTPMMAQFMATKQRYPDTLLFYRMGDFYEMFFDDAETAAPILDITLTKRGKNQGNEIPMAGVPFHSCEPYIAKLIRAGFKVAICEQTETPEQAKKAGRKLVNRDVVRILTQGTLTEDNLLESGTNNYLAALMEIGGQYGLAWLELSTGEFNVQPLHEQHIGAALERVSFSELVIPDKLTKAEDLYDTFALYQQKITRQPTTLFDSQNAQKRLENIFGVGTLESFGGFSRAEIAAAGALIDYVERTQVGKLPHINRPSQLISGSVMEIDAATRRNLELTQTLSGEKRGSLLHCIDRTVTSGGARLLHTRLSTPLCELTDIQQRLDEVETFTTTPRLREDIREQLKQAPDIERALARLTVGRGGPRDLGSIRQGLKQAETILAFIATKDTPLAPHVENLRQSTTTQNLVDTLTRALKDELPMLDREGGYIREGYSKKLDDLRTMRDQSKRLIAGLQEKYRELARIDSLKISYNNVLGYFIEVPAKKADPLLVRKGEENTPDNPFIHRQTMANAVRFTTPELAELERDLSSAADKALALEQEFFAQMVTETANQSEEIGKHARALAALDVSSALAELAVERDFTRPELDNSMSFDIKGGRHAVVEQALKQQSGDTQFVPNDCDLGDTQKLWLLTGPNMAGKSTFLRQNALIAIMAQMGGFVPASSAHIGVVDRVFSRVGASDDLARGRSTFMVEMVETAAILNMATERSLVILDEIGRGTATFDGLSIAWACVEHLHETSKCRGLFATHYHELTTLSDKLGNLSTHSMQVKEWKGDIVFLHSVAPGSADRSYGIHVARLAGLPDAVITRAKQVLDMLEKGKTSGNLSKLATDLPLFSTAIEESKAQEPSALEQRLSKIDPDSLTPKEALDLLYELKKS